MDQLLEELTMKKLAIIALAGLASSAFATNFGWFPPPEVEEPQTCETCPAIVIDGHSTQMVAAISSIFLNKALGEGAYARQNVSSNSGNVTVHEGAFSTQLTGAKNSAVVNLALTNNAFASQNVSSNVGKVDIDGWSTQLTALKNSGVINVSAGKNRAVQNLASNNGCATCN